jgi:hypothetical protein
VRFPLAINLADGNAANAALPPLRGLRPPAHDNI